MPKYTFTTSTFAWYAATTAFGVDNSTNTISTTAQTITVGNQKIAFTMSISENVELTNNDGDTYYILDGKTVQATNLNGTRHPTGAWSITAVDWVRDDPNFSLDAIKEVFGGKRLRFTLTAQGSAKLLKSDNAASDLVDDENANDNLYTSLTVKVDCAANGNLSLVGYTAGEADATHDPAVTNSGNFAVRATNTTVNELSNNEAEESHGANDYFQYHYEDNANTPS